MKFKTNGFYAYCIKETDEGVVINDGHGFVMEAEQMIDVANKMIKYAKKHGKELEQHNAQREIELQEEMYGQANTTRRTPKEAYVYMFECGGRYKVGYSSNVERRIEQLNNRPFPVTIIAVSRAVKTAYAMEQHIHNCLEQRRVGGEWYELSVEEVEIVKDYIESI